MLNIFEQPWFLLIAGVVLFFVQRVLRAIKPEKFTNIYLLVPVFVFVLAFLCDYLVKTDAEKIDLLVKNVKKSIVSEDTRMVEMMMADDYRDDYHRNKAHAISHLKKLYDLAPVDKALIIEKQVDINKKVNSANVEIKASMFFQPQSPITFATVKFSIELSRNANKLWLISSSQIHELNKQPVSWQQLP